MAAKKLTFSYSFTASHFKSLTLVNLEIIVCKHFFYAYVAAIFNYVVL